MAAPPIDAFRRAQWRMLLATMFCYLFYYTGRQTFGFAIPGISEELSLSKAELGLASGVLFWCYAVGQAINGNLGDRFGGRLMMSLGAVISASINGIVSLSQSLMTLLVPWGLNGFAQSMGWAPGSRVISNWWGPGERGKVYGLYVFAAGMSSVLAFATSLLVLDTFQLGWRWIFRLPVLLLLGAGLVYYLVARNHPRDLGFSNERDDRSDASMATSPRVVPRNRYQIALTNPRFLIASLAIGFQSFARYGLIIWVPVYFLGENWKNAGATAWISMALAVGMAAGALLSGWLSDRRFHGRRAPLISICLFSATLCVGTLYFVPKEQAFLAVPLLFLSGFFVYGPQANFWALCPDLLGPENVGTGTGVMNFFAYLFAGLEGPLIGFAIDRTGNATAIFPVVALACAIGGLIALAIRR